MAASGDDPLVEADVAGDVVAAGGEQDVVQAGGLRVGDAPGRHPLAPHDVRVLGGRLHDAHRAPAPASTVAAPLPAMPPPAITTS